MSTKCTWLKYVLCVSLVCVLWGATASAEVVARSQARTSMSLRVDPWESQWDGCIGATESAIFSDLYMGQNDSQGEPNGGDGFSLASFVEQPDIRNMAQGSAEVARMPDGYGKEAAMLAAEGEGELSGPNYYLTDFASAENHAHAMGGFVADHTSSPLLNVNSYWTADLLHAYEYAPPLPDWEIPEVTVLLRMAFMDGNGDNLLTAQGPWELAGDGYLEISISSQDPGFYESDSWYGNWRVNLIEGESYGMFVQSDVTVQSPGGYVPEPTAMSVLVLGSMLCLRRRWSK